MNVSDAGKQAGDARALWSPVRIEAVLRFGSDMSLAGPCVAIWSPAGGTGMWWNISGAQPGSREFGC